MNETEKFLRKYVFGFNPKKIMIIITIIFFALVSFEIISDGLSNKLNLEDVKLDNSLINIHLTNQLITNPCSEVKNKEVPQDIIKVTKIESKYYDSITYSVKCENDIFSEIKVKLKVKDNYGGFEYED